MKIREYQELAAKTMRPGLSRIHLLFNIVLGIIGEFGELADYIKKGLFHGHAISIDVIEEELGDWLWYLSSLATYFDIDLEEVAQKNIEKLKARYPKGFSVEDSIKRRDKK